MTPEEINEAVAKKLGGERRTLPDAVLKDGTVIKHYRDYCHSIEAAWEIVEWCKKEMKGSWSFDLTLECGDRAWRCGIFDVEDIEADTAPMAIALAFLKLP